MLLTPSVSISMTQAISASKNRSRFPDCSRNSFAADVSYDKIPLPPGDNLYIEGIP
jgi:hypothetical protein